jgi:amphi-Trp domain-containing protein
MPRPIVSGMGDEKSKVDYEIQTTLDEAVSKLEGLVAGLKSRQVILRNRSEAVELHPTSVVNLAVKAKQKDSRESIEISIDWKNDPRAAVDAAGDRSIGPGRGRSDD